MNILKEYVVEGLEPWQKAKVRETDVVRTITKFTYLPLHVNNKWSWFQRVKVLERLHYVQYEDFDDGYSYQSYWKKAKEEWWEEDILEVIKK